MVVGIVVGLFQFLALKSYGISTKWVVATAIAATAAALINSYAFSFKFDTASLVGSGLVAGLLIGLGQALSQTKEVKFVLLWTLCTTIAWTVAWFITSKVIVDPEAQYHVYGSSGALLTTIGLSVCLKFLLPATNFFQHSPK